MYEFATAHFWISFYEENLIFFFMSVVGIGSAARTFFLLA
jgi:hypothetical protein